MSLLNPASLCLHHSFTLQVTDDFLKYLRKAQGGERDENEGRSSSVPKPKEPQVEEEEEEDLPYPSAQELVRGVY